MLQIGCPDRDTLEKLLLGKVAAKRAVKLEEHLLQCDNCSQMAETASANDEVLKALRTGRVYGGDQELLAQAIERGKQLRCETDTLQSETTILAGRTDKEPAKNSKVDAEEIDFLAPPEQPDEIGRLGGYRVLGILGVGGMGVVFRAEDPALKRDVALKAMRPAVAASKSAKERFLNEAKATAAIEHDHIVAIYQVGEDREVPFIAMQYLPGESLNSKLEREKQCDQRDVLRLGREIAAGLAAAHKHGLIHRDIKPDNIWLDSGRNRVKILDFGLVRSVSDDSGLTINGVVVGTPKYMSPEQAEGGVVDNRSDLFSLGSVLYQIVSGKAPFSKPSVAATLAAVTQANPTPIETLVPGLHPELSCLIMQLLSRNPDDRPASAARVMQFISQIERQLDGADGKAGGTVEYSTLPDGESSVAPHHSSRATSRPRKWTLPALGTLAALAVLGWLWASGILFHVETPEGTLVVKVSGDDFATVVKGQQITFKNTKTNQTYIIDLDAPQKAEKLQPGAYQFMLTTDSELKTRTERFTIASGKNETVEVWWEPKVAQVADAAADHLVPADTGRNDQTTEIPKAANDPFTAGQRKALNWVLSIGGSLWIVVDGKESVYTSTVGIPDPPFQVGRLSFRNAAEYDEKSIENLNEIPLVGWTVDLGPSVTDSTLAKIMTYPGINSTSNLNISQSEVTDAGLIHLKQLRHPWIITLDGTQISAKGLDHLKELPFRGLNLRDCKQIKDDASPLLIALPRLRWLSLEGTSITDAGLVTLAERKTLDSLDLRRCKVSEAAVKQFADAHPKCHITWDDGVIKPEK